MAKLGQTMLPDTPYKYGSMSFDKGPATPEYGTAQDWLYSRFGSYAYMIQLKKHNPVSLKVRKSVISENREIAKRFLASLHKAPSFQGRVLDKKQNPIAAQIRVRSNLSSKQKYIYYEGEKWKSRKKDGYFFQIVGEPGVYEIEIRASGYKTTTKRIQVDASRVQSNIILRKN